MGRDIEPINLRGGSPRSMQVGPLACNKKKLYLCISIIFLLNLCMSVLNYCIS